MVTRARKSTRGQTSGSPTRMTVFLWMVVLAVLAGDAAFAGETDGYILGPKDVIHISVLGVEELERDVTIPSQGSFSFPPIGVVRASGRTAAQVQAEIQKRLADGYVREPVVVVIVKETASRYVTVIGAVKEPGPFPVGKGLSLLEVIAQAKGLTENSSKQATIIRRQNPDRPLRVNLKGLMEGNLDENVTLHDGDIVIFPSVEEAAEKVNVLGAVRNPGAYPCVKGMGLVDVLTAAGGPAGDAGRTVIVLSPKGTKGAGKSEKGGNGVKPVTLNLMKVLTGEEGGDLELQNRDTIIVPSTDDFSTSFFITGEVKNPGMYAHRDGMTVLHAITMAGGLTEAGSVSGITVIEQGGLGKEKPKRVDLSYRVKQGDMILVPRGWF